MNKEIRKVKCVDFTFDGQGLTKDESRRTVFVPSLLIDEVAEVEILYRKKDYDIGKIVKICTFSPYRIKPLCPCSTSCGGCTFQNLTYEKELEYKKKNAINTLESIAKIKVNNPKIYGMENPYYYRNKIQVPFGYDKQNRLVYGFYKFKTHDIVPNEVCAIESKEHVNILKTIKRLMISMKISAYREDSRTGIIRHVLIRVGKVSKEVMVVIVVNNLRFPSRNNFVKALTKECKEITTVVFNENSRKTNAIIGEKEDVVYGKGYIFDYLLGIKFKISSKSFYQINHDQCEVLYGLAIQKANLTHNDNILDAYCGIGTIGLCAAKYVKTVEGIEIVNDAILDARMNAKINNIENAKFSCVSAENFQINKKYDCIFVDPPRKGLDDNFINQLFKVRCNKIIYISCNVGTLARDLLKLKEIYKINSIDFVDMFPRTYHVETVIGLYLKK